MLIAQAGACRTAAVDKNPESCSVPVSSGAAAAGAARRGGFGGADEAGGAGGFGGAGGDGADGSGVVGLVDAEPVVGRPDFGTGTGSI
jgi:DNA polymerase-3 subunit gamma/tau